MSTSAVIRGWPWSDTASPPITAAEKPRAVSIATASVSDVSRARYTGHLTEFAESGHQPVAIRLCLLPGACVDRGPFAGPGPRGADRSEEVVHDRQALLGGEAAAPGNIGGPRGLPTAVRRGPTVAGASLPA